jgi:hypothetical protein
MRESRDNLSRLPKIIYFGFYTIESLKRQSIHPRVYVLPLAAEIYINF